MAIRQLVIFKINDEDFGVEITQVKEIIKPMDIYKVPNTPDFIEGLINLRGMVHTVFNLRKKFNLPVKDFDDNTKIIIVNVNDLMVGFIVDEVNEIIRVDEENIEKTPQSVTTLDQKYLNGVAKFDDRLILLLDLTKVLSSSEESEVKKVMDSVE